MVRDGPVGVVRNITSGQLQSTNTNMTVHSALKLKRKARSDLFRRLLT